MSKKLKWTEKVLHKALKCRSWILALFISMKGVFLKLWSEVRRIPTSFSAFVSWLVVSGWCFSVFIAVGLGSHALTRVFWDACLCWSVYAKEYVPWLCLEKSFLADYYGYMLAIGLSLLATLAVLLVFFVERWSSLVGSELMKLVTQEFVREREPLLKGVGRLILWAMLSYLLVIWPSYNWRLLGFNFLLISLFALAVVWLVIRFVLETLHLTAKKPNTEIKRVVEKYGVDKETKRLEGLVSTLKEDLRYYIGKTDNYKEVAFHMELLAKAAVNQPRAFARFFSQEKHSEGESSHDFPYGAFRDLEEQGKSYGRQDNVYTATLMGVYRLKNQLSKQIQEEENREKKKALLEALGAALWILVSAYPLYKKSLPQKDLTGDERDIPFWMISRGMDIRLEEGIREVYSKYVVIFIESALYYEDFRIVSEYIMPKFDTSGVEKDQIFVFRRIYDMVHVARNRKPSEDWDRAMQTLFSWMKKVNMLSSSGAFDIQSFLGEHGASHKVGEKAWKFYDFLARLITEFDSSKDLTPLSLTFGVRDEGSRKSSFGGNPARDYMCSLLVYLHYVSQHTVYIRPLLKDCIDKRVKKAKNKEEVLRRFADMDHTLGEMIKEESEWEKWEKWIGLKKEDAEDLREHCITSYAKQHKGIEMERSQEISLDELDHERLRRLLFKEWEKVKEWFDEMKDSAKDAIERFKGDKKLCDMYEVYSRIEFSKEEDSSIPEEFSPIVERIPKVFFAREEDKPQGLFTYAVEQGILQRAVYKAYINRFYRLLPKASRPKEITDILSGFAIAVMGSKHLKDKRVRITLGGAPGYDVKDSKEKEPTYGAAFDLVLKVKIQMEVLPKA